MAKGYMVTQTLILQGWKAWVVGWEKGAKTEKKNRVEQSVAMRGIELIDPATIATPANVLL